MLQNLWKNKYSRQLVSCYFGLSHNASLHVTHRSVAWQPELWRRLLLHFYLFYILVYYFYCLITAWNKREIILLDGKSFKIWNKTLLFRVLEPWQSVGYVLEWEAKTRVPLRSNCWYSCFYIFVYNTTFLLILPNFNPLQTEEVYFF